MADGSALIAALRGSQAAPSSSISALRSATPAAAPVTTSFAPVATPWARNVGAPINFTAPSVPQPGAGSSIDAIRAARNAQIAMQQEELKKQFTQPQFNYAEDFFGEEPYYNGDYYWNQGYSGDYY